MILRSRVKLTKLQRKAISIAAILHRAYDKYTPFIRKPGVTKNPLAKYKKLHKKYTKFTRRFRKPILRIVRVKLPSEKRLNKIWAGFKKKRMPKIPNDYEDIPKVITFTKKPIFRDKFYFRKNKRLAKKIRPLTSRFARRPRHIRRSIARSFHHFQPGSKKQKHRLKNSYLSRYVLCHWRVLEKRVIRLKPYRPFKYLAENRIFNKLRGALAHYESNKRLNSTRYTRSSYTPLSVRDFLFGIVHITHHRRNTFVTISNVLDNFFNLKERVIYQTSSGLIDYAGPKRKTFHGRQSVIKVASSYLANNLYTSIDIIFSPRIGRMYKRIIRDLCKCQIYVRYIVAMKGRSHGHTRKKKLRRL